MSIVTADIWSGIEAVITSTTGNRVYVKSVPRVRISPAAPKRTPSCWVVFFFCIQRFEQGMSEAKKRPSGAFSARLHRRGITIDATCPVPSIVPLPRKRLPFSATGSVSPLSVSRCGNTASESLLLRQIKPPSFDGGFIFYSALSTNWAFLPLLPQHLSCGEDGVANALRAGTEDLAGLHAL